MKTIMLSGLELAINQYLNLDPDTLARLGELEGKTIKIELTDWETEFFILPNKNGLQLFADHDSPADTTIKATLMALTRATLSGASSKDMFANKVAVRGDTHLGEQMREILTKIDIDWEEHLSKVVGDSVAHQLMRACKGAMEFVGSSTNKLIDMFKVYVHEEARIFPNQKEVDEFSKEVNEFRNGVERLEARIKRCEPPVEPEGV